MKLSFSRLIFNRVTLSILCTCTMFSVRGFDLPVFYRAPFFQPEATQKIKDWTTVLAVRVGTGDTTQSFNNGEDKTALFNANGPFNLARLGLGIEGLSSKPVTNSFWGPGGAFANSNPTPTSTTFAYPNGSVEFGGSFSTIEGDLILKQNLLWGFYAHVYVPYKQLEVKNITTTVLGTPVVNGVNMSLFIKNSLPAILMENGLNPYNATFNKTGFGDIALSAGWQGYTKKLCGLLSAFGGFVQIGIVLPVAPKQDPNTIFSLPLGYNQHTGVVSRTSVEAGIWNIFTVGLQAGSLIFFKNSRAMYLKTDKAQNGWIVLQKSYAQEDLGSIWDVAGYAKMNIVAKGLDILVGYSFTRQEATVLQVHDPAYLATARANVYTELTVNNLTPGNPVHIGTDGPNIVFVSQNDYANSDTRLTGWEAQTLHFLLRYDMSFAIKGNWGPLFQVEYNYPVWGRHSWATDIIAGTLGFTVSLNF